jgi:hypothetical protein
MFKLIEFALLCSCSKHNNSICRNNKIQTFSQKILHARKYSRYSLRENVAKNRNRIHAVMLSSRFSHKSVDIFVYIYFLNYNSCYGKGKTKTVNVNLEQTKNIHIIYLDNYISKSVTSLLCVLYDGIKNM